MTILNNQKNKIRLFVDMDGTLAEWRNISFDLDITDDAEEAAKKLFDILQTPGYFYSLRPNQNVINCIKSLYESGIEIYILSCYPPDKDLASPKTEKDKWLDKYLPEIDIAHRIYVPYGHSKNQYVPNGISHHDFLLDDKTSNLTEFEQEGGQGIKLLNGVNSTYGTWDKQGKSQINFERSSDTLFFILENILLRYAVVQDKKPKRRIKKFDYESFDFESAAKEMNEELQKTDAEDRIR